MPLRKTVAMERRIDLASLFCLIARHGPAVLVTLVVIGCSLAGFIMFRNMWEKRRRRRATARSEDDDGDDAGRTDAAHGGLGEDAEPPRAPELEASRRGSTDDEEHVYHSHVRHRRAPPQRNPYKDKLPDGDSVGDKPPYSFFWNRYSPKTTESHVEEARYRTESTFSHPSNEGVTEDVREAKETGLKNDDGYEEKEKVIEADSSDDITSTTDDVSDEEFAQEEETVQFAFNSQPCAAQAPIFDTTVAKELAEETKVKQQEHEPENSLIPGLEQDEIQSEPRVEDHDVALEALHNEQNLSLNCSEAAAVHVSTTPSVEVMEEDTVEANHSETCESEPCEIVDTKDVRRLEPTSGLKVAITDLSSDSKQQTEPSLSTEIYQNGLCPQEQSCFETDKDKSSIQNDTGLSVSSNTEAVSHSLVISGEVESLEHKEMTEKAETETPALSDNTAVLQNQQNPETSLHIQDSNQAISNQNDTICEEKQTTSEVNKLNIHDQEETRGINVDSKHEECTVHPPASQSHRNEVMEDETGPSGPTAVVEKGISAVTATTPQTNQEQLRGASDLDTETIVTSQKIENESAQTCQNDDGGDGANISASTRDKIESMVEQLVADVYKDVTQSTLEAKPMPKEEDKSTDAAQDTDSTDPDEEVEREVEISSGMEEVVHSDSIAKVEDDELVVSDATENKCVNGSKDDDCKIMETEDVPSPQNTTQVEEEKVERLVMDKNVENEISAPENAHLDEQTDIKLEENAALEQLDKLTVEPVLEITSTAQNKSTNEPEVKVVEQEESVKEVCLHTAIQMLAEATTVSFLEVSNITKVDVERGIETETEQQSEPKDSEVLLGNNGLSNKTEDDLETVEGAQEVPSGLEAEVPENKTTLDEQRESGMASEPGSDSSNVKSRKVVIVCRTVEAGASTVEMSDSEDDLDDINGNPTNEVSRADIVASSSDTDAIGEMTSEENRVRESNVTLDIPQDCAASTASTERKDCASTPSLESGISSMTASPEKEDCSKAIGQDDLISCQVYPEESVCSIDSVVTITKEESVSMESKPLTSNSLEVSPLEDVGNNLLMTNEDSFGSEIEDGYLKGAEEFMIQVVDNLKSASNDVRKEKEQACAESKENGEKVESEKTDISIMEATMDHNEWITDGNYQVLPWMTAASFSKDPVGSKEEKDAVESRPQASCTEESVENAKKVLAVQPMPQSVNVTFRIHYVTLSPDQTVAVIGDLPELGAWKSVVPLEKTKDGYWTCVVSLPVESHVEWKFVVLEKGEVCRWEECGNRQLHTGYGDDLLVHKWWGFL